MGDRKGNKTSSPGKIARPAVSGIFARERLFTMLDSGQGKPVTWVSGPAGSGKTTLVASYVDTKDLPCLWYQVDEGDGDVATFFYYMGMAAKKAAPRKRKTLPLLAPEYLADLSTFSRRYFESLCDLMPRPFVIVFDNYQDAPEDSPFHDVIRDGLGVLPEGIQIISLSRTKIPQTLTRLQASGSIASIGWNDMQFTRDESAELLRLRGFEGLSEEVFNDLQERTQGWAAGLVLMTETVKAAGGASSLPHDLGRQEVFDYFAGEILDKTDVGTREFLLKTAFLPKIAVPVAEQLTDSSRSEEILSGLNRNHYFTERHASGMTVYQYHPLFREFLLSRAKASYTPEQITVIRLAAAALLEDDGQIEDAAGLYFHAGEWEGLVRLVQQHARSLINQGRGRTLEEWLGGIPDDIMVRNPWLFYWLGICRMMHDLGASRESLERAFSRFKEQKDSAGLFLSWSGIIDTYVYEWSAFRPLDRWITEIEGLLQEYPVFPTREIEARVTSGIFCALMYRQPHHKDLPRWEERAKRIVLTTNDIQLRMAISSHLIFYYTWWSGEQAKAATLVNALRPAAQVSIVDPLSLIVWRAIEAAYHWMACHNEDCLDAVDKGLHLAETTGVHLWDFMLSAQASFGTLTAGNLEAVKPYLRTMGAVTRTNRRVDIAHYYYHLAWEALCRRDLALARENAQTAYTVVSETGTPFIHAFLAMGLAEVLIELGEFGKATGYLDEAREMGMHMNSKTVAYQHAWLAALLCLEQGDEDGAREHLRRHLAVSKEYGILNHAWWRSSVMARLYAKALEAGIEVDHVQHLIRKRKVVPA